MISKTSASGLAELAGHEGIVLAPYLDSKKIWTWGVGHTAAAGRPDPAKMARGVDRPLAEAMDTFVRDVSASEARVRAAFTRPLIQTQFDAAVSFDHNTGAITRATWVKKFNAGDTAGARKSIMDWRKPKEIIPRRQKERDLFFDGKYSNGGYATVYSASPGGAVLWSKGTRVKVIDVLAGSASPAPADAPKPVSAPQTQPIPEPASPSSSGGKSVVIGAAGILAFTAAFWATIEGWWAHVINAIQQLPGLF